MATELTDLQLADLARHFLGPTYTARWEGSAGDVLIAHVDGTAVMRGVGVRDAFRSAGVQLPLRSRFTAQGTSVMLDARAICTAVTNTMAKRICAALNEYIPGRRGI